MSWSHRGSRLIVITIAAVALGACSSVGPGSPSAVDPASLPPSVLVSLVPSGEPASSIDPGASPPFATLAAEGGDPVAGQLGSYVWAGGGSDSPWLPGAPITVGVAEPLRVTFQPTIDIDSWAARFVPSTASDPTGARSLGEGTGVPQLRAPVAGSWTVEVHVVFADGAGNASYFWKVTAR